MAFRLLSESYSQSPVPWSPANGLSQSIAVESRPEEETAGRYRKSMFRETAGRIINPNSITVAKVTPLLYFSSITPTNQSLSVIPRPLSALHLSPEVSVLSIPGQQRGLPKTNQDAYFSYYDELTKTQVLGVCDGHGQIGGLISSFVSQQIPSLLSTSADTTEPLLHSVYRDLQKRITDKFGASAALSGCTCVLVIIRNGEVTCANVGDSRAVLVKRQRNVWHAVALSVDHKPSNLPEAERILQKGGKIAPLKNARNESVGPLRVWAGTTQSPGLAMTRSLGDTFAHKVGVSAVPDVLRVTLTDEDSAVIVASDGLWDVMSAQDVAAFARKHATVRECCSHIVHTAQLLWTQRGDTRDDLTVIMALLRR